MCAYIYVKKLFWAQKVCKKNLLSYGYDISHVKTKISDRNFCGMPFFADFPANFSNFKYSQNDQFLSYRNVYYMK